MSVELSRGPVVSALLEHDFFRLFPVLPTTVANYRAYSVALEQSFRQDPSVDSDALEQARSEATGLVSGIGV